MINPISSHQYDSLNRLSVISGFLPKWLLYIYISQILEVPTTAKLIKTRLASIGTLFVKMSGEAEAHGYRKSNSVLTNYFEICHSVIFKVQFLIGNYWPLVAVVVCLWWTVLSCEFQFRVKWRHKTQSLVSHPPTFAMYHVHSSCFSVHKLNLDYGTLTSGTGIT
jgi:hypothetical protein